MQSSSIITWSDFLVSTLSSHIIVCPWGQGMGSLLGVQCMSYSTFITAVLYTTALMAKTSRLTLIKYQSDLNTMLTFIYILVFVQKSIAALQTRWSYFSWVISHWFLSVATDQLFQSPVQYYLITKISMQRCFCLDHEISGNLSKIICS